MVSVVSAFGVFRGRTKTEALAKLRLAVTGATGREPTADDAAALTVLAMHNFPGALDGSPAADTVRDHPIFGSGYTNAEANEAAEDFKHWTD